MADQLLLDPVTGAFNRQGMAAHLAGESGLWEARMIDLIGFGDFTKYSAGDRELAQFARALSKAIVGESPMTTYLLSRWGGDEFLLFLQPPDESHPDGVETGIGVLDQWEYYAASKVVNLDTAWTLSLIETPKPGNGHGQGILQVNFSEVYSYLTSLVDELYAGILELKGEREKEATENV